MWRRPKTCFIFLIFGATPLTTYLYFNAEDARTPIEKIEPVHPVPNSAFAQHRPDQILGKGTDSDKPIFASPFGTAVPVSHDQIQPAPAEAAPNPDIQLQRNEQNWPKHSDQQK